MGNILEVVSDVRVRRRKALVARSAVIAGAAVLVAAASHVLAGGNTPTLIGLVSAMLVAMPLTLVVSRPTFGMVGTFVGVGVTQMLFHWLFVFIGVDPGGSAPLEPLPAHAEHFNMVGSFVPIVPEESGAGIAMWLSHAVAAILTTWLIRRGEVALGRLSSLLRRVLWPSIHLAPVAPVGLTRCDALPDVLSFFTSRVSSSIPHRGPPVRCVPC